MKNVLLDLDGTLTDPFTGITRCIVHALTEIGAPVPSERELGGWIGPPLQQSFLQHLGDVGGAARALDAYRERFGRVGLFENEVYDEIPVVMETLAQNGRTLRLATAKPRVYAVRIVEHFGLDRWLNSVYGSELDGTRTDKTDLLEFILEQEGLNARDCVMVGDREHDIRAARHHGMRAVGVRWGYGSESELLAAGAERLVASPGELLALILSG